MTRMHNAPFAPVAAPALPGTWKLAAGRAITLRPAQKGLLRIAHGRVWVTREGPHAGPLNALGDCVLDVGDRLAVDAGQSIVIESLLHRQPAFFTWDPVLATVAAPVRFGDAVQPLQDLRSALQMAAGALVRLASGLARLAWQAMRPAPAVHASCSP